MQTDPREPRHGPNRRSNGSSASASRSKRKSSSTAQALDKEPFIADGGFSRLNKVFDGELEACSPRSTKKCGRRAGVMTQRTTRDIVAKLWNLCHVLRDDGVTYNEYVTELTYLLFLKMLQETGREDGCRSGYRWGDTRQARRARPARLLQARCCSTSASRKTKDELVRAIFTDAQTKLRKPTNLRR